MPNYLRGDVVLVDLGMAAKVRPCVVVSIGHPDSQRNMSIVVPMTSEIRHSENEISFPKPPWLRQTSVVNLMGIVGVDNARIQRRIASFPPAAMAAIDQGLARVLGLPQPF